MPALRFRGDIKFPQRPDRFHLRSELYDLLRCRSCSCVWLASPPTPAEMPVHYDEEYYRVFAEAGEKSAEGRWRGHRDLIARYKRNAELLDIGRSTGAFLSTLKGS